MYEMHREYEPNLEGRDFIVSDIHGMVEMLFNELGEVGFDYDKDRCFCVGDLVDRGHDSELMLKIEKEPWFHTVYGNHEDLFVKAYTIEDTVEDLAASWLASDTSPYSMDTRRAEMSLWTINGGGWTWDTSDEAINLLVEQCKSFPIFITIDHPMGKVGICHAQAPTEDWNDVYDCEMMAEVDLTRAIWGRTVANGKAPHGYKVDNVDITVHGHTIMLDGKIMKVGNSFFIDTGAFGSIPEFGSRGSLTLINIEDLFGM